MIDFMNILLVMSERTVIYTSYNVVYLSTALSTDKIYNVQLQYDNAK